MYKQPTQKKLKIGWFDSIETLASSPAVKRAIKITKESLEAQGHTLVPFRFTGDQWKRTHTCFFNILIGGLYPWMLNQVDSNYVTLIPLCVPFKFVFDHPWISNVIQFLLGLMGQKRIRETISHVNPSTSLEQNDNVIAAKKL